MANVKSILLKQYKYCLAVALYDLDFGLGAGHRGAMVKQVIIANR